jgi:murein DD-endopeptidase MepM/ murein hydrolase activator NlpD
VKLRIASVFVLAAAALAGGAMGAAPVAPSAPGASASAKALAVRIVLPGGKVVHSAAAASPSTLSTSAPAFSYPADGSVVVTGDIKAQTASKEAKAASSSATSAASNISLFEGEITVDSVKAHAVAATNGGKAGGAFGDTGVVNLQALGRPHAFGNATLADWGYLTIAGHSVTRSEELGVKGYDGISVALDLKLTAAHGGLPAGAEIQVGYAEASAQTAPPEVADSGAGPEVGDRPQLLPPTTGPLVGVPQVIEPPLTAGGYIYPVYGRNDFSDQYGTAQNGNAYQHGVDLFGQLGQPLVAVADGTIFSVGWNHNAGNRLWLRDHQGNQFYYAHLSAFSTLTSNGAHVRAGQVIGFMGNTGQTRGEPTHLHFEVHPVSMLFLGSDGAVDPVPYFASWHRLATLSFPVATGWAPAVPGTIKAPEPGAVFAGSTDISTVSGLDRISLHRVLRTGG